MVVLWRKLGLAKLSEPGAKAGLKNNDLGTLADFLVSGGSGG